MYILKCTQGLKIYEETALKRNVDLRKVSSKKQKILLQLWQNNYFVHYPQVWSMRGIRAYALILLWAGFNVLVQSGSAEGSQRSLFPRVFILTMTHHKTHIKLETSHSSTAILHCYCAFLSIPTCFHKFLEMNCIRKVFVLTFKTTNLNVLCCNFMWPIKSK